MDKEVMDSKGSLPFLLDEIKKDAELIRLDNILNEARINYNKRLIQLYSDKGIKYTDFTAGIGLSGNADMLH